MRRGGGGQEGVQGGVQEGALTVSVFMWVSGVRGGGHKHNQLGPCAEGLVTPRSYWSKTKIMALAVSKNQMNFFRVIIGI